MDKSQLEITSARSYTSLDVTRSVKDEVDATDDEKLQTVKAISATTTSKPSVLKPGASYRDILRPWFEEIIWCIMSIVFLVVIIVVLRSFDGRDLPSLPLNITLNTFLAFFTTMTKAAFMLAVAETLSQWKWNWFAMNTERPLHDFQLFDDASRGPWGSLKLLMSRLRGRNIATIGAMLPIISIITSPVTQQTIQYPLRRLKMDGIATTLAVKHYKSNEDAMGYGEGPLRAASSGLTATHGTTAVPSVPPTCTAGDCTFPRFNTLGICTSLNNITSLLNVTRIENTTYGDWSTVHSAFYDDFYKDMNMTVAYNISLPNSNCWAVNPLPALVQVCTNDHSFLHQNDTDFQLANFYTIPILYGGPRGFRLENDNLVARDPNDVEYQAFEINVYACVKTLETRVINGSASIKTASVSYAVEKQLSTAMLDLSCHHISFSDDKSWMCSGVYDNRTTMNSSTPVLALRDPLNLDNPSLELSDYYTIDAYSMNTIVQYLGMHYPTVWTWDPKVQTTASTNSIRIDSMWGDIISALVTTNDTTKQMARLQLAADNVATAFTNGMQISPPMRGAPNAFVINGTNWALVTFVEIHWGWLCFLAIELVVAVMFLAATITFTHRAGVQVLKSSALATFFAPAQDCRDAFGGVGVAGDRPAAHTCDLRGQKWCSQRQERRSREKMMAANEKKTEEPSDEDMVEVL